MLIDMIHDNHGEPPFKTRYRDPAVLRAMGYEAVVIPDALAAVPSARQSGVPEAPGGPSWRMPRKPEEVEASIDAHVKAAADQGMKVFFYGDGLLLPAALVERDPAAYLCDDGSGRLCPGKPTVYQALRAQVDALFARWPSAAGLVMRVGEVYPEATPHMTGSPLHAGLGSACPSCGRISLEDRLVRFITCMHDAVVRGQGKLYVHRTWQPLPAGTPSIHDDPDALRSLSARLPESPLLAFSFKLARHDFGPPVLNPCLFSDALGGRQGMWIEFPCEREYEAKGAYPNYQAALWQEGLARVLAQHGTQAQRLGIWGWSRGGGWGGPYVQREEWIDANVRALADLYTQPESLPQDLATAWTGDTFGIAQSSPPAPAIAELLLISPAAMRKLLYVEALGAGTRDGTPGMPRHGAFLRDDSLDVEAIWMAASRVVDAGRTAEAIAEKREALDLINRMRRLFDIASADLPNKAQARDLANTLACQGSLAATIDNLFAGFIRFFQWSHSGRLDADAATQATGHLQAAQASWQLHTQRHAQLPGAPSIIHEQTLWERTNNCLSAMEEE